jgi:hypothetical protein
MSFTATQTISSRACLFDWRARVGPFGMILARDVLTESEGQFDILAFGVIPIARAEHNSALMRGELMRYLAEIAWAPDAIFLPTPWRGRFSDYRQYESRWIPFAGEVAWEIEGKWEIYWQGRLKSWETR